MFNELQWNLFGHFIYLFMKHELSATEMEPVMHVDLIPYILIDLLET